MKQDILPRVWGEGITCSLLVGVKTAKATMENGVWDSLKS